MASFNSRGLLQHINVVPPDQCIRPPGVVTASRMVSSSYLSVGGRVGALGCRPPSSPSRSLKYVRIGHPSCHISPAGFQRWCRLLLSVRFRADNDVNYDPPSLRNSTSFHAAGLRSGAVQVRLLQQCPIWTVNVNNLNSSACPELCSTVGRHTTTLHRS